MLLGTIMAEIGLMGVANTALIRREAREPIESAGSPTRSPLRGSQQPVTLASCSPRFAGKYWPNRNWNVFSGVLFAAVLGVLVIFGAQPAGAQTPSLPQAGAQQPASQSASVPAAYCKQSTLTGPAFLNLLNTVIKHGDLTDIAFLQKTLGTKFSLSYGSGVKLDGSPDHQRLEYDSDQMLGIPIHVHVDVHLDVIEGKPSPFGKGIAWINFEGLPFVSLSYIDDCMKLSVDDLVSRYGAHWIRSSNGAESEWLQTPGKDNTKLAIGWTYDATRRIGLISISQSKK